MQLIEQMLQGVTDESC